MTRKIILVASFLMLSLACTAQVKGNYTINVENEAAAYYLQHSDAVFADKAGSLDRAWFDRQLDYRPDQPSSLTIAVDAANASDAQVLLAGDARFRNVLLTGKAETGTFTFTNFVPGRKYYYKFISGGKTLKKGMIRTAGQLRMIAVPQCFNIRDLGGWKGLGGKTVRYEQIYRGGSPGGSDRDGLVSDMDAHSKEEMHRIGIRAQLDLRALKDSGRYPHELSLHSYTRDETTLLEADFNNTMTDNGAYCQDASLVCDLAWIIYELRRGKPVFFNCRQGADRTGAVSFLIEALLGCYEYENAAGGNQMAMDYELTGFSRANLVDNVKVFSSVRGARQAYLSSGKIFYQLLSLEHPQALTLQQKCYWYLNQRYADEGLAIDDDDLDWFIMHMLGMSQREYAAYRPSFAKDGAELRHVGEAMANTVRYSPL